MHSGNPSVELVRSSSTACHHHPPPEKALEKNEKMAELDVISGALALHLGGARSGRQHGKMSDVQFRTLVEEGAEMFGKFSKDKEFSQLALEWKTVMVQFQKKMIELLGIWKRIRQISRDFLRRFEELSLANGDTNAKFPLSMKYHLIYVFTDELRGKGLEAHSAWSSESTTTVYRKIYFIVHDCVKAFNYPPSVAKPHVLLALKNGGDEEVDKFDDQQGPKLLHDDDEEMDVLQSSLASVPPFIEPVVPMTPGLLRVWKKEQQPYQEGQRQPFPFPKDTDITMKAKWMRTIIAFYKKFVVVEDCPHLQLVSAGGGVVSADQRKGWTTKGAGVRKGTNMFLTGTVYKVSTIFRDFPLHKNRVVDLGNGWCLKGEDGIDFWQFANTGGAAQCNLRFTPASTAHPPMAVICQNVGIFQPIVAMYALPRGRQPSERVALNEQTLAAATPKTPSALEMACSAQHNTKRKRHDVEGSAASKLGTSPPISHSLSLSLNLNLNLTLTLTPPHHPPPPVAPSSRHRQLVPPEHP